MANRSNNYSSSRSRSHRDREDKVGICDANIDRVSISPMRYKLKKLTQAQTLTQIAMVTQGFYAMSAYSADWVQRDVRSREFSSFGNLPMPNNLNMIVTIIGDENYYLKLTMKNHNMDYICYDSDNNELQFWGEYQCCIRAMNELRYRIHKIQQRMEKEFNKQWPVSRYSPVSEADAGEKQLTRDCEYDDDEYTSARDEYAREEVTVIDPSYSLVAIKQMNKMGFVDGHGLGATGTGRLTPVNPVEDMGGRSDKSCHGLGFGLSKNVEHEPLPAVPAEPVYVPAEPVYVPVELVPVETVRVLSDAERYGCKCNGDTGICCMSCWRNADA